MTALPKRYDTQNDRFAETEASYKNESEARDPLFQLTIPGSGSILQVDENILIDRIVQRLTGGAVSRQRELHSLSSLAGRCGLTRGAILGAIGSGSLPILEKNKICARTFYALETKSVEKCLTEFR